MLLSWILYNKQQKIVCFSNAEQTLNSITPPTFMRSFPTHTFLHRSVYQVLKLCVGYSMALLSSSRFQHPFPWMKYESQRKENERCRCAMRNEEEKNCTEENPWKWTKSPFLDSFGPGCVSFFSFSVFPHEAHPLCYIKANKSIFPSISCNPTNENLYI